MRKRHLIAGTILIALIGLMVVQFRLLIVGAKLEKQKFDQKIEKVLLETKAFLNEESPLSDSLINLIQTKVYYEEEPNDSLKKYVEEGLFEILKYNLEDQSIAAQHGFFISDKYSFKRIFYSSNIENESLTFGQYRIPFGERIIAGCRCEQILHLSIINLFGYLLKELDYLIIPSALCVIAILVCLVFLMRNLRNEQKLNAIKNEFINNLTHELKTPVFSISIAAKILKEKLEKGEIAEANQFLQLIDNEKEKLKIQIDKVLELATLESGQYKLKKEPTNVHELIKQVVQNFEVKIQERGGNLQQNLNALSANLHLDKAHFKNVILNLLENALKYSNGRVEINIETQNKGNQFILGIKDKGIGIDPKHHKEVFEKFYRVPSGDLHNVKGFGLGLNYVKRIVEAHGGKIELESEAGKGATFEVYLSM